MQLAYRELSLQKAIMWKARCMSYKPYSFGFVCQIQGMTLSVFRKQMKANAALKFAPFGRGESPLSSITLGVR